jgi:predicted secreted acid phosphatase
MRPTSFRLMIVRRASSLLLGAALAFSGCATLSHEPPNLTLHKQEIRAYVDSGRYQRDITAVASRAQAWLEQRAAKKAPAERQAVIFDLDETLFLNWPQMSRQDFGYVIEAWEKYVEAANAPPIEPVREVYRTARRLSLDVIFLTGRPERQRAATERNLRAIDCGEYAVLICRPNGAEGTSAAFKTGERQKLVTNGLTIIANVGDQESDLVGGFAEKTFKLPSPFYLTE